MRRRHLVPGRLSTFIELGVGFNMDLAARDNVVMNGIMMGLAARGAQALRSVIDFAELSEFKDLKLKNYSSGMQVRLAFSVAIQVDADILLIDEVLAVGDAAFQQKCFDVFHQMRDEGKTIVFVTHDMTASPLLPPGDAARARLDRRAGRAKGGRRPVPRDQLRARRRAQARPSPVAKTGKRGSSKRGWRTNAAKGWPPRPKASGSRSAAG